jgi:DNA gyrase/topoisomerase IV subunit A
MYQLQAFKEKYGVTTKKILKEHEDLNRLIRSLQSILKSNKPFSTQVKRELVNRVSYDYVEVTYRQKAVASEKEIITTIKYYFVRFNSASLKDII